MIEAWPTIHSRPQADYRIFRVRQDFKRSPRTGREHDFYILECPDWVNVVALTSDQQIILVEQYRHGTNTMELEIPGGVMDSHDASPVAAALRELREETGYEGRGARIIGCVQTNPAFMTNACYTVLVEDCQLKHPVQFDHTEDVVTRLMPAAAVPDLLASGRLRHSLAVVALQCWLKMQQ